MFPTKQKTRLVLGLIVSLTGLSAAVAQLPVAGVPVPELEDFDDAMQDFMAQYDLEGGVLAVSKDGCVVYQRGFGWLSESYPLPENTLMRLASVEKPLTAAMIRILIDLGHFSLDDHVFDLDQPDGGILDIEPWQDLGDDGLRDITVENLLRHRGGWDAELIGFDPQFEAIFIAGEMGIPSPPGRVNTARYMLSQPLQHEPDTEYAYCNFGYMLLGLIVEQFEGPPHVDAIREHVLTPDMWVPATELIRGRTFRADQSPREPWYICPDCDCVNVYDPDGPSVSCPYGGWDHESFTGHGNLVASAAPLLTFLDNYVVGGANIGTPLSAPTNGWHTGAVDGTSTIARQRSDGINVVVLFNQRMPNNDPDLARTMAADIYELIDDPNTPITWPTLCVDGSWLDFDASSSGFGGYDDPFHTMDAALAATAPGVKLRVKPGASNWTGTISMRMRIDAPLGTATIGQ